MTSRTFDVHCSQCGTYCHSTHFPEDVPDNHICGECRLANHIKENPMSSSSDRAYEDFAQADKPITASLADASGPVFLRLTLPANGDPKGVRLLLPDGTDIARLSCGLQVNADPGELPTVTVSFLVRTGV